MLINKRPQEKRLPGKSIFVRIGSKIYIPDAGENRISPGDTQVGALPGSLNKLIPGGIIELVDVSHLRTEPRNIAALICIIRPHFCKHPVAARAPGNSLRIGSVSTAVL